MCVCTRGRVRMFARVMPMSYLNKARLDAEEQREYENWIKGQISKSLSVQWHGFCWLVDLTVA